MTEQPTPLEPLAAPSSPSADVDVDVAIARELEQAPCWPITRLANGTLTLALCLAVFVPITIARAHGLTAVALLLPAVIATLAARALFESIVSAGPGRSIARHLLGAIPASALALVLMAGTVAVLGIGVEPVSLGLTAILAISTLALAGTFRDLEIRVRLRLRRVYFVGSRNSQLDLARELGRRSDARLVGSAAVDGPADRSILIKAVRESRATVLVLDHAATQNHQLVEVASALNLDGLHVRDLVSYYESEFKKVPLAELSPTWFLFDVAPGQRRIGDRILRRTLELAFTSVLLILALPALVAAVLAIKLTSSGPVLYRQQRVGKGGTPFTLVKLRTMTVLVDGQAEWAAAESDRITPVGRFLRRFRLDELPQLWNVILGNLSLIGPRPEQVPIVERLDRELPHYSARHAIRPGITGWAQVNLGYAGSVEGTIAKLQRDLYYVKHSSLRLDALILWLTIKTVISGRG
ncbi:MAG: exopolysaccharide biosynthesis polyprenyl glycosylphosphotransferase [Solirubrobacteraceae bacterium]